MMNNTFSTYFTYILYCLISTVRVTGDVIFLMFEFATVKERKHEPYQKSLSVDDTPFYKYLKMTANAAAISVGFAVASIVCLTLYFLCRLRRDLETPSETLLAEEKKQALEKERKEKLSARLALLSMVSYLLTIFDLFFFIN